MLIAFFYLKGLVHREFMPFGQSVIGTSFCGNQENGFFYTIMLQHTYLSLILSHFLGTKLATVIDPVLYYSPDVTPDDFLVFPKLKVTRKGQRFDDVESILKNETTVLYKVSKEDYAYALPSNSCMSNIKCV